MLLDILGPQFISNSCYSGPQYCYVATLHSMATWSKDKKTHTHMQLWTRQPKNWLEKRLASGPRPGYTTTKTEPRRGSSSPRWPDHTLAMALYAIVYHSRDTHLNHREVEEEGHHRYFLWPPPAPLLSPANRICHLVSASNYMFTGMPMKYQEIVRAAELFWEGE
jgi:hypothetical protein